MSNDPSKVEPPSREERASLSLEDSAFRRELEHLVNCHSMENGSDTPDFILAQYLLRCLQAFDEATLRRNEFFKPDVTRTTKP